MAIDFVTLCAAYAAWRDPNYAEAAMSYGMLSPEEPCRGKAAEAPTWWPSAAEAARLCHLSERAVVLCTGLSTHDTYAEMRSRALCSLTQCTILGPASTSPAFRDTFVRSLREMLLTNHHSGESQRDLYHTAMRSMCKEWAQDVALAAAAAAPCLLLLPADMEFLLALCSARNELYLPHFGVHLEHVYIGQALDPIAEPLAAEPEADAQVAETEAEGAAKTEAEANVKMRSEEPSRAHKTRSARDKKRRFAFWRYCAPKK